MGKMLTLDELQQMTAMQQSNEAGEVKTVDLSPTLETAKDFNHLNLDKSQSKVDALTNWTVDDRIARAEDQQVPQMYQPKGNLKPVQSSELAPPPEKKTGETLSDKWVNDLNKALDRDKKQMWDNVIQPKLEELSEQAIYGDVDKEPEGIIQELQNTLIEDTTSTDADTFFIDTPQALETVGDFNFDTPPVSSEIPKTKEPVDWESPSISTDLIKEDDLKEDTMNIEPEVVLEPQVTPYSEEENKQFNDTVEAAAVNAPVSVDNKEESQPVFIGVDIGSAPDIEVKPEVDDKPEPTAMDFSSKAITSIEITTPVEDENIAALDLNKMFSDTDLDEEDSGEAVLELTDADKDEEIKNIQMVIRKEARPSTIINLSEYSVASKATSATKVLASMANKPKHSANWTLLTANRPITMSELSGPEIEKLDPSAETGLNEVMRNKELYSVFFDHVVDANKPASFEGWTKTIPFVDVPHLYFTAYRASFSHAANLLPFQCGACKHNFMEKKPVESMVKFKDDAAKETVKGILKQDPTNKNFVIKSKIFIISDEIAISFKTPSIYNIVFETAVLPEKFRTVYQNLVYYINCIEDIFMIDQASKKLIKVETKIDPTDINKTVANRYKAFASILQRMSPDEFSYIPVCMKEVNPDTSDIISYQIPETVCPRCGKKIPAQNMDAISLLFTRLRLQTILTL